MKTSNDHIDVDSTHELLHKLAEGDPQQTVYMRDLFSNFGERGFGMLLFFSTLPAFIPIPVGGPLSGPLVVLVGLQMMALRKQPWLPKFIADRGPRRHFIQSFERKISRLLKWVDRITTPRMQALIDAPYSRIFSGVLLVVLGILLSLPIPFTNYVFGVLLIVFALALLERDGRLLLITWIVSLVTIASIGMLSQGLVSLIGPWIDRLI